VFKDRELAIQVLALVSDIARLRFRADHIVSEGNSTKEERKNFSNRICLAFDLAIADLNVDIYKEHPDLAPKDALHPPGFFQKKKEE